MSTILIQSRNRSVGTATNAVIEFQPALTPGVYHLVSVYFPNNLYNVLSGSNTLILTENSTSKTGPLPPGSYNNASYTTGLAAALTAISNGYNTYTVTLNNLTGMLTIAATNPFVLNWSANPQLAALSGFTAVDTPLGTSVTASARINLIPTLNVRFCIDGFEMMRDSTGNNFTFLIPLTVPSGGYMLYESTSFKQEMTLHGEVRQFKIVLKGDQGQILDLGDAEWHLVLQSILENPENRLLSYGRIARG